MKDLLKAAIHFLTKMVSLPFVKTTTLVSSFSTKRTLPKNFQTKDLPLFAAQIEKKFEAVRVLKIKNARLVAEQGIVIKAFHVVEESLIDKSMLACYGLQFIARAYTSSKSLANGEKYLFVYNHYSAVYGHWLADVLPRLYVIKNDLKNYKILLPENYSTFQAATLIPFGISENNIKYVKNELSYKVPDLTIVSHVGGSCNTKDEVLQDIRKFYLDHYFSTLWPAASQKLYVSRARQTNRKVINEDDVQLLVSNFGFKIIYPEDYSFEAQVKLFASCKTMVGITGSALTNMLFMQRTGNVVEFKMKNDKHNLHYFAMSSGMQLDYYYLLCDVEGEDRLSGNFNVDVTALEAILKEIA